MIVSAFMWSYERDAVEVLVRELEGTVDRFVAVQGDKDFRGRPRQGEAIDHPLVRNVVVDLPGQTSKATPWDRENQLRAATWTEGCEEAGETGWVALGDGDEIPHPDGIRWAIKRKLAAHLPVDYREWWMDRRAPNDWQPGYFPFIARPWELSARDVNKARVRPKSMRWVRAPHKGWHLSTLGDAALAAEKVRTYSHREYDNGEWTQDRMERLRLDGVDMFERFTLEPTQDLPSCATEFPHLLAGRKEESTKGRS